jgi:polysaccharide biosynthesis protein PelA
LTLELPEHERGRKTALVAVGSRGGYAALNYEFCHPQPPLYQGRWLINPFQFFRAALGADGLPIPDTTTVSGRRMYFGLLGAEGWSRPSKIEEFRDSGATASEVVLRELIRPFDNLPTTIDLPEDIFPKSGRSAIEARQVAQDMLTSPNVQRATRHFQASRSRFDAEYPSISNLSPLTSLVGDFGARRTTNIALNAGAIYDNAQATEENGFAALEQTAANTDAPRRLKPFNLNYQAGVGERPALLQSVRQLLQLASAAPLANVSADRYAAIVDGFFDARIERLGNRSWQIRNRGALQTMRFDDADGSDAALALSRGVIGQRHVGHALYVALDEAVDPAIVVLDSSKRTPVGRLALEESRWLVRNVASSECALRFDAQGYGEGEFSWSGASSSRYSITVTRSAQEIWRENAEPDAEGRLRFTVPVAAIAPITIEVTCFHSAAQ